MKKTIFLLFLLSCYNLLFAQKHLLLPSPKWVAFVNATIHQDTSQVLENATFLIRGDEIVAIGKEVKIPENTQIIDIKGRHIYPSFIDIYTSFGITLPEKQHHQGLQYDVSHQKALATNDALHPERNAYDFFSYDHKQAKELQQQGFGLVVSHVKDGVARGTSSCIALVDKPKQLVLSEATNDYSFSKGHSHQEYPRSLMGMISLLRQSYYDAQWYEENEGKIPENLAWRAWNEQQQLPQIFEANDKLNVLRADEVAQEFNKEYIVKGGGNEYQIADELQKRKITLIEPVNFSLPIDVSDVYEADWVSLKVMKEWEWAPKNLAILSDKDIPFVLTTTGLEKKTQFLPNLQKAISAGVSENVLLDALTQKPANLLGLSEKLGTLEKGKKASFIISEGSPFQKGNVIYENWVLGERNKLLELNSFDIRGEYDFYVEEEKYSLSITGALEKPKFRFFHDSTTLKSVVSYQKPWLNGVTNLIFDSTRIRFSILFDEKSRISKGKLIKSNGEKLSIILENKQVFEEKKEKPVVAKWKTISEMTYPFQAYGYTKLPVQEKVLIKNPTVWTNGEKGILKNTDVLLLNGRVEEIGQNLTIKGAKVIDGTGKHLTTGIIDEHSHIAIYGGVNEATDAVTAQVRIGDVINHEDINIYRQLGGGVTAIQQLHGSANPIGGQSSLIKLRWGSLPNELKIQDVDGFIKFALGENVKQSNWGSKYTVRYPQTRMGVEQVYELVFLEAKEYETQWKTYNSLSKKEKKKVIKPRKDLQLEAVLEIINKKRFITCHSYVQSEILMLMEVAERHGFRVNTFTHVLEGYKVAEQLKKHGAYASTFADWWAYKFEVNDAIPYNGAMLTKAGVVTAINSDFPEPGRRLNIEAAKLVKYGGLSEEEAWKTVTLNPAIMLHLDNRMGKIEIGMDADVVLWSDNPLSIYAQVEQAYIEGVCLYDIEEEKKMQKRIQEERNALIQKMILEKSKGLPTLKPTLKKEIYYHCEDLH
ncbi:MAG: amidohydrolase family protein [Cytophagales bacterium]|nr:amidohydrolase family protein [Cytophagales bacterium]